MFLLPLPPMWPNTVQLWWWQSGTQHCRHSDDVLEAAVHWGFPEPHLPLQEQRGLHGRLDGQPEEGRAAAGLQRRGDQSRRQQPLHLQRVGGRLHGKTTEILPNGVSFPVNMHRRAEFSAAPWIVLVYAISPQHRHPSPALPAISPISQTIYFSAISQQVTGRLTAVLFFSSRRTETHRTVGQDGDRVQIAEDLSSAHCGHCPHWHWRNRSGVRSRGRPSLLLVKTKGLKRREKRGEKPRRNITKEEHTQDRGGEKQWKKKKIKTLFFKMGLFLKVKSAFFFGPSQTP